MKDKGNFAIANNQMRTLGGIPALDIFSIEIPSKGFRFENRRQAEDFIDKHKFKISLTHNISDFRIIEIL